MARRKIGEKVQTTVPAVIKEWATEQAGRRGLKEADIIRDMVIVGFDALATKAGV